MRACVLETGNWKLETGNWMFGCTLLDSGYIGAIYSGVTPFSLRC
jgi:hypothetical protein